jgi:hypothetical protein
VELCCSARSFSVRVEFRNRIEIRAMRDLWSDKRSPGGWAIAIIGLAHRSERNSDDRTAGEPGGVFTLKSNAVAGRCDGKKSGRPIVLDMRGMTATGANGPAKTTT